MDETYIKVKGEWKYLYRAVDKFGKTIDFVHTEQRDEKAARQFLNQAIGRHGGAPEKITIDGSAANEAAIQSDNKEQGTSIEIHYGAGSSRCATGDTSDAWVQVMQGCAVHPHRHRADAHAAKGEA